MNNSPAPRRNIRWLSPASFVSVLLLISAFVILHPSVVVGISLDGQAFNIKARTGKVETVLREAGIKIDSDEIVSPALNSRVVDGESIVLKKPNKRVRLTVGDTTIDTLTAAETVGEVLAENGISLSPGDLLMRDNYLSSPEEPLDRELAPNPNNAPPVSTVLRPYGQPVARGGMRPPAKSAQTDPVVLLVKRAAPLQVHDNGFSVQLLSTEDTVGQALEAAAITLNEGDAVTPGLDSRVHAGMNVYIQRSKAVNISVDGDQIAVRTLGETVGQVLSERGIQVGNLDMVEPTLDSPITEGLSVRITRVAYREITEEKEIPFAAEVRGDPDLEIDHWSEKPGKPGVFKRLIKIRSEDGEEKERIVEREWVDSEPQNYVKSYGTKIVLREIDTPEGTLTYWRRMRVFATSYDADGGGKAPGSPGYGITALGMRAQQGVIAVDPGVIPFYTRMYVPGYGTGVAGDTGGGVRGFMIDLAYEVGGTWKWGNSRYVDIYLLAPAPPPNSIRWTFP